jgi:drug/metabolite transporter (DMT)-like permease
VLVRGLRGAARTSDVLLALAVATSIAGYTLVDQQGVRYADPITYVTLILVAPAIIAAFAVERRGPRGRLRAAVSPITVAGGAASITAYGLVLVALTQAPAASVAAVREVSVVIGVGLAALVLRERVGAARLLGSTVVAVGVALVVSG